MLSCLLTLSERCRTACSPASPLCSNSAVARRRVIVAGDDVGVPPKATAPAPATESFRAAALSCRCCTNSCTFFMGSNISPFLSKYWSESRRTVICLYPDCVGLPSPMAAASADAKNTFKTRTRRTISRMVVIRACLLAARRTFSSCSLRSDDDSSVENRSECDRVSASTKVRHMTRYQRLDERQMMSSPMTPPERITLPLAPRSPRRTMYIKLFASDVPSPSRINCSPAGNARGCSFWARMPRNCVLRSADIDFGGCKNSTRASDSRYKLAQNSPRRPGDILASTSS
mmetsp:Transcript_29600/g.43875  ORF Transcript_29600/g.43875 Transcript_29600/m.43875 type:complete len:288 (-) Transcript_29600:537-1400(-)